MFHCNANVVIFVLSYVIILVLPLFEIARQLTSKKVIDHDRAKMHEESHIPQFLPVEGVRDVKIGALHKLGVVYDVFFLALITLIVQSAWVITYMTYLHPYR